MRDRRLGLRLLLALAGALIFCSPACAEPPATASPEGFTWQDYQDPALDRPAEDPVGGPLGLLVRFGVVVGLIYAAAWAYKKGVIPRGLLGVALPAPTEGSRMRVVDHMALKGAQSLHLVEIGDRMIVVGSDGRTTLVKVAEWQRGTKGFETVIDRYGDEAEPGAFTDELESTLRQVIRPSEGDYR